MINVSGGGEHARNIKKLSRERTKCIVNVGKTYSTFDSTPSRNLLVEAATVTIAHEISHMINSESTKKWSLKRTASESCIVVISQVLQPKE